MTKVPVRSHLRRAPKKPKEPSLARLTITKKRFREFNEENGGLGEMDVGRKWVFVRVPGAGGGGGPGERLGDDDLEYVIGADTIRENAMDNLDDLLGFDVVPPTYIRATDIPAQDLFGNRDTDLPGTIAVSVQDKVPDAIEFNSVMDMASRDVGKTFEWDSKAKPNEELLNALYEYANKDDIVKIAVLDIISRNTDRHGGNFLVQESTRRVYAIDHELTFDAEPQNQRGLRSLPAKFVQGEKIPDKILAAMREVQKGDFYAALAGIPEDNIEAAWDRKMKLQKAERFPRYTGWN